MRLCILNVQLFSVSLYLYPYMYLVREILLCFHHFHKVICWLTIMEWDSARTMQTTIHTVETVLRISVMAPGGTLIVVIPTWMGSTMGGQSPPEVTPMVSCGIPGRIIGTLSVQVKWRFAPCSPTVFMTGARWVLANDSPSPKESILLTHLIRVA